MKRAASRGIQTNKQAFAIQNGVRGERTAWLLGSLLEGTYTQSREIRKVYKLRHKGWIRVNRVEKKKNPQRTSVITAKGNGSSNTKKRGQVQYK